MAGQWDEDAPADAAEGADSPPLTRSGGAAGAPDAGAGEPA